MPHPQSCSGSLHGLGRHGSRTPSRGCSKSRSRGIKPKPRGEGSPSLEVMTRGGSSSGRQRRSPAPGQNSRLARWWVSGRRSSKRSRSCSAKPIPTFGHAAGTAAPSSAGPRRCAGATTGTRGSGSRHRVGRARAGARPRTRPAPARKGWRRRMPRHRWRPRRARCRARTGRSGRACRWRGSTRPRQRPPRRANASHCGCDPSAGDDPRSRYPPAGAGPGGGRECRAGPLVQQFPGPVVLDPMDAHPPRGGAADVERRPLRHASVVGKKGAEDGRHRWAAGGRAGSISYGALNAVAGPKRGIQPLPVAPASGSGAAQRSGSSGSRAVPRAPGPRRAAVVAGRARVVRRPGRGNPAQPPLSVIRWRDL